MNKRSVLAILLVLMLAVSSSSAFAMGHEVHEGMDMENVVEEATETVAEEAVEEVEEMEAVAVAAVTPAEMIVLTIDSTTALVDGKEVTLDVAPFIAEGRTMVPLAFVSRQMGAEVVWDAVAKTVTYTSNGTTIVLTIDSTTACVNGVQVELDSAPTIHVASGRTMVPLRFVGTLLGYEFAWDGAAKTVTITVAVEAEEMEEAEEVTEEEVEEVEEEVADETDEVEDEEAVEGEE